MIFCKCIGTSSSPWITNSLPKEIGSIGGARASDDDDDDDDGDDDDDDNVNKEVEEDSYALEPLAFSVRVENPLGGREDILRY